MTPELNSEQAAEVERLAESGNGSYDDDHLDEALIVWNRALNIIPDPKTDFEEALWLYTSIADVEFELERYEDSFSTFQAAYKSPGGVENPFICLRLGQLYLKLNDAARATEFLLRAYMLDGEDVFEDEPPELLELLRKQNLI